MSLCRFCKQKLKVTFVDLGMSPLSNAYLKAEQLNQMEPFYPLHAYVCQKCYLVQLEQYESPQKIFSDYAYFSSYSDAWLKHSQNYVDMMVDRFHFNANHQVIEIASNDGYLLQYFHKKKIPVLGIEPAANVAKIARSKGIPNLVKFFGVQTARWLKKKKRQADLLLGNNVLAHVPDLNDFVAGLKLALKSTGIITMEFPHILKLIQFNQFDTIYHEHFSYFSLLVVEAVFKAHGLILFDVEELPTHGGSLRIFARHKENKIHPVSDRIHFLKNREKQVGLDQLNSYQGFKEQVHKVKRELLEFLIRVQREGKKIVGYGAPAKGNTLLNYAGVGQDFISYTVDRSPYKQNYFLPGTHIPIFSPSKIKETRPDYILILPWNIQDEIIDQMSFVRSWGGRFVIPIPSLQIL